MEELIHNLLTSLGEDPAREGLERTPQRVAEALAEMTRGYGQDAAAVVREGLFASDSKGLVVCRDVEFVSMCEHHLLPFFGRAVIAYAPAGRLVGISKLARVTDIFARRLQVQERMGQQILDVLQDELAPRGALVHLAARHLCMMARGVRQEQAEMVTLHVSGLFEENPQWVSTVLGDRA